MTAPAQDSPEMLAGVPRSQRRAAQDQRRPDCRARGEDVAEAAVGRAVRPARQLEGRSQLRRPPHLHLQGQGGRPAGPPRLRPRRHRSTCRSSRPTPARSLNASWLGIYGNCVIIDHGLGVQSLYGHLSSFDVKVGDTVTRGQTLGRSGMTGLAGGDHLHFTMLVGGQHGEPGRVVGSALDDGPGRAEAQRSRRGTRGEAR